MLLSDVANYLQDKLNSGDVTFRITANEQRWYNYAVRSADDMDYVAGVVRALPIPVITDYYRTRALDYIVTLKGRIDHETAVESIVNGLQEFVVEGNKWYLSNFVVDSVGNARDGKALTREFRASFRLSIYVPFFLTGQDVTVKIDGVEIPFIRITSSHDKALIPNRPYGLSNFSDINTGEELVLNIPVLENSKVIELFSAVKNNSYNREFNVSIDYKVLEKAHNLVLSGGNALITNDTNGISFNAVFTKALERTLITINGQTIDVYGFTPNMSIVPNPLIIEGRTITRPANATISYQMQLVNDKSELITNIVTDAFNKNQRLYTISWEFNGSPITTECRVQANSIPSSENANALVQVIFTEGR